MYFGSIFCLWDHAMCLRCVALTCKLKWIFIASPIYRLFSGAFPCLEMQFIFKRNIVNSLLQLYMPSTLVVILSWLSFWISADAIPARVTIGMLPVLTMTTQCTVANSQLPRVSYIKTIDVWISTCLVFVFASLLEFAVTHVISPESYEKIWKENFLLLGIYSLV